MRSYNPPPSRSTPPRVHPLWGSTFSMTHHPVSGSDIIFNGPSSLLVDIVLFEFSLSSFSSRFLKRVCYGGVFTPLIKNVSFSSLTDVGSPPRVHPLWGLASSLTHRPVFGFDIIGNGPNSLLAYIVLFEFSLSNFSSRFLKRVYYREVFTPL